ncbi:zinc-ribbon domain-containing protein [Pseudoroseicyclus tamaricis]|uniref:Thioredoxin n=1 Tax=Pseudoroseicyclus tamaricis TaxID=2705421 RepID=A0A6B2JN58_9RHOB|nr:zinc-ribbon domain-containing protein [Pseudoroseicyclus tamaricis]NDU99409.1 thioredoxin [Pseudoroseicyclus tamaricis]
MRLICPNCGAQYEVPDDVIPEEGRDVQCSACSHTWFEEPGASVAAEDAPSASPSPSLRTPPRAMPPRTMPPQTEQLSPLRRPEPEEEAEAPLRVRPKGERRAPPPPPSWDDEDDEPQVFRPSVTPEVAAILREEAAREAEKRRMEREAGVETQTELELPERPRTEPKVAEQPILKPAPDRVEPERPARPEPSAERASRRPRREGPGTDEGNVARRELLPDIDELHSSLRADEEPATPASDRDETESATRRGFRRGFTLTLLLLAVFALAYVFAPQIAARVPALSPTLASYVDAVDAGRIWLELRIQSLTNQINTMAGSV